MNNIVEYTDCMPEGYVLEKNTETGAFRWASQSKPKLVSQWFRGSIQAIQRAMEDSNHE